MWKLFLLTLVFICSIVNAQQIQPKSIDARTYIIDGTIDYPQGFSQRALNVLRAEMADSGGKPFYYDNPNNLSTITNLEKGEIKYIKEIRNGIGGGHFAVIDSSYPEDNDHVYGTGTNGQQLLRIMAQQDSLIANIRGYVDPTLAPFFAYNDSSVANATENNKRINHAIDSAYAWGVKLVKFPPGKFLYKPYVTSDDGYYGLRLLPGMHLMGSSEIATELIMSDASGPAMGLDSTFSDSAEHDLRNIKLSDMTLRGYNSLDITGNGYSGGAGPFFNMPGTDRGKQIIFENLHVIGFGNEALTVWGFDFVRASNLTIEKNDFTALNFSACKEVVLTNVIIDSCRRSIEDYGSTNGADVILDSTTTRLFTNISSKNNFHYGMRFYSANDFSMTNFTIHAMKNGSGLSDASGIQFYPTTVLNIENFGRINLSNGTIEGNGGKFYNGLEFGSSDPNLDTTFNSINIDNLTIKGCRYNGIVTRTRDNRSIKSLSISNSTISDNNVGNNNTVAAASLAIRNVDTLLVNNNRISNTLSNSGRHPVYLLGSRAATISNNDFNQETSGSVVVSSTVNPIMAPLILNSGTINSDADTVWSNIGTQSNKNGDIEGTVTLVASTPRHLSFPGTTSDYVRSQKVESDEGLYMGTGTFEIYFRPDGPFSATECVFGMADSVFGSNYWAVFIMTDSTVHFLSRSAGAIKYSISSTNSFTRNSWYHLVWQIDSTLTNPMRMYINGIQEMLVKTDVTDTTLFNYNAAMVTYKDRVRYSVGGLRDATPMKFTGDVALVRMYDKYLSDADIQELYQTAINTPYEPLVYNNKGLTKHQAVYYLKENEYEYQTFEIEKGKVRIGGAGVAYEFNIENNDSLMLSKLDSDGNETGDEFRLDAVPQSYSVSGAFSLNTDTLSITNAWTHLSNDSQNLFIQYNNNGFSLRNDTLIVNHGGVYNINGQITVRQADGGGDLNTYVVTVNTNEVGVGKWTVNDTLEHCISFGINLNLPTNNHVIISLKSLTGNEDVIVTDGTLNVSQIKGN